MSGHWPPEWEDPGEEFPEQADQLDAAAEARLSEVAAFLASVPAPALPDAVEARISAALAEEAGTRADHAAPADGSRNLGPAPDRARVRRQRGGGRPRRGFRVRPQVVGGSLVTCLLLVVLGFALSHAGSSSSSSSAASGSAAEPVPAASSSSSSAAAGRSAAGPAVPGPQYAESGSSFVVSMSGTRYQQATLAEQVRSRLPASGGQEAPGTTVPAAGQTVPAASASASSTAAVPSPALRGCVLRLTNGVLPRLVDRATYQGNPAYIIASPSRVWVVGLGCTAAKTEVVTSVPLAGLPGNLRALVSVEQHRRTS
jgi:hypothetical protein